VRNQLEKWSPIQNSEWVCPMERVLLQIWGKN